MFIPTNWTTRSPMTNVSIKGMIFYGYKRGWGPDVIGHSSKVVAGEMKENRFFLFYNHLYLRGVL